MAKRSDDNIRLDRFGHNNCGIEPTYSRITFMCHANGYVMARRPGCTPFVISEKLWRSFEIYAPTKPETVKP